MGARVETATGVPDAIKWLVVAALMGGAVAAFYYYGDQSLLLRVIGLLLVTALSVAVALQTEKGRLGWEFVREARTELRKVVWPTRKETTHTTAMVFGVVAVVALVLWLLDGVLARVVRALLSHGS